MTDSILMLPIILPVLAGLVVLLMRAPFRRTMAAIAILAALASLLLAVLFLGKSLTYSFPWGGFGWEFSLRVDPFSSFILLFVAGFSFLVALYSWKFMEGRRFADQFYCYLLGTLGMASGAVLANHLVVLLFFWEGLLLTLFGMIAIGSKEAFKTATKALIIVGVTDLCLMFGIALTGRAAGTLTMSRIHLPLDSLNGLAAVLMIIGAISKAGSMPFHSWIPDAASDAPLPFMAFLPASLEKLLGIYLLARISLDMFALAPGSWVSPLLMIVGSVTILLAVMMALVQKDFKKLLSYHAISQVGYMILGIGTAVPAGIVGGLFHMVNNALYKSCLFLTGGSVEKQAGTTDLSRLGGLGRKMPLTFVCFFVAAMSISGFPLTNGFFSKELVYEAAKERHVIFYLAALLGTFFTAASFLKLGHAAFLGKRDPANDKVREAPLCMLTPMIVLAAVCLLFGLYNALPLRHLIQPSVKGAIEGKDFSGLVPHSWMLAALTCVVLGGAFLNHLAGARRTGSGLHAVDHIHHAPVLNEIYDRAEKKQFDPYEIGVKLAMAIADGLWRIDRGIDWVYDTFIVGVTRVFASVIRSAHTGSYAMYVLWCLAGAAAMVYFLIQST